MDFLELHFERIKEWMDGERVRCVSDWPGHPRHLRIVMENGFTLYIKTEMKGMLYLHLEFEPNGANKPKPNWDA